MINYSKRLVAGFIVFLAVICGGCSSIPSPEIAAFLAKQGFDAEVSYPSVSSWESQNFNLSQKEQWDAKSRAEVPNWRGAYYKFTIVKESYRSPQEAQSRLTRLYEKPPGLSLDEDYTFFAGRI